MAESRTEPKSPYFQSLALTTGQQSLLWYSQKANQPPSFMYIRQAHKTCLTTTKQWLTQSGVLVLEQYNIQKGVKLSELLYLLSRSAYISMCRGLMVGSITTQDPPLSSAWGGMYTSTGCLYSLRPSTMQAPNFSTWSYMSGKRTQQFKFFILLNFRQIKKKQKTLSISTAEFLSSSPQHHPTSTPKCYLDFKGSPQVCKIGLEYLQKDNFLETSKPLPCPRLSLGNQEDRQSHVIRALLPPGPAAPVWSLRFA